MPEVVPFKLSLSGSTSDRHQFQGYDGYMALAGFAWSLALISNYMETGKVRHRGEFPGRSAVQAEALKPGSIEADFNVYMSHHPHLWAALGIAGALSVNVVSNALWDLTKRILSRHVGDDIKPANDVVAKLIASKDGDVEALVAATEPAVRQTHSVIGNGANVIQIYGGNNSIGRFTPETKSYVNSSVEDPNIVTKAVSVAAFNVNSGHGSVFDKDLGRTVPIAMNKDTLKRLRQIFSWGLDQYANSTGAKIEIKFWRVLAMDGTPKRYVIVSASI